MKQPLFTIVTVTYNAEDTLQNTIDSVKQQTYKNIEYIVIDGNSKDRTKSIIQKNLGSIDYWISESDSGIYEAMNKGTRMASGQWINFMNAGDSFADSEVLAKVAAQTNTESNVIYGDRYYHSQGIKTLQKAKSIDTIFERMPFGHQSAFVRTEILKPLGFNETYKFAADYNLFVTLYMNKCGFKQIDLPVCNFEAGGQSESGLRPYLETIKILLDNTSDKPTISKNIYFRKFLEISKELCIKTISN